MRITDDYETAEELTLDVFHDVWRRASNYDASAGTVVAWVMNQARSRAIDRLRFDGRKKRVNPYNDDPLLNQYRFTEAAVIRDEGRLLRNSLSVKTADERVAI